MRTVSWGQRKETTKHEPHLHHQGGLAIPTRHKKNNTTRKIFRQAGAIAVMAGVGFMIVQSTFLWDMTHRQREFSYWSTSPSVMDSTITKTSSPPSRLSSSSSSSSLVYPNLLYIGVPKAGTTATSEWIFSQPQVCHAQLLDKEPRFMEKEVQFFNTYNRFVKGNEFYAQHFQHCQNNNTTLLIDSTPNYLKWAPRIRAFYQQHQPQTNKNLKIIVSLRDPMARELSFYNHKVCEFLETRNDNGWYKDILLKNDGQKTIMTFDEYVDQVVIPNLSNPDADNLSMYARYLKEWFEWLDRRHQILVLSYDELQSDTKLYQSRVTQFLNQTSELVFQGEIPASNQKKSCLQKVIVMNCETQAKLQKIFGPMNQQLYRLLKEYPGPWMEQTPFPEFQIGTCHPSSNSLTTSPAVSASSPTIIYPNVLYIGVQKAGTTSVTHWLFSQPSVCHAQPLDDEPPFFAKEVHFFNYLPRFSKGKEFYAKHFQHCQKNIPNNLNHPVILDATPNYLKWAPRIHSFYQQAAAGGVVGLDKSLKILVSLRDPMARELSNYNHKVWEFIQSNNTNEWYADVTKNVNGTTTIMSFEDYADEFILFNIFWKKDQENLSLYAKYLKEWFERFDRTNILVLSYDELKRDSRKLQWRLNMFLKNPTTSEEPLFQGDIPIAYHSNEKHFPQKVDVMSCRTRAKLQMVFEPMNQQLYRLLQEYPGPSMEQNPFPAFDIPKCV